jgi:hypothetical protein
MSGGGVWQSAKRRGSAVLTRECVTPYEALRTMGIAMWVIGLQKSHPRRIPKYVMLLVSLAFVTTATARDFEHSRICEAIRNGWETRLIYRPGEGERIFAPRYLGYTSREDVILNGWQISGFSQSGKLPGSRSFRLDRTTDIQFTTKIIPGPPGLGRPPSGIVKLICARLAAP